MTNHDVIKNYSAEEFAAWFAEYAYQAGINLARTAIENFHELNIIDDIAFSKINLRFKTHGVAPEKEKLIAAWTTFLKEEYNEEQNNSN